MIVDKKILEQVRGLFPCTNSVTFVPEVYRHLQDDKDLAGLVPSFTCRQLTNGETEACKSFLRKRISGDPFDNEKESALLAIGGCVENWSNLVDISTGEFVIFSKEKVAILPEVLLASIVVAMSQYAGIRV